MAPARRTLASAAVAQIPACLIVLLSLWSSARALEVTVTSDGSYQRPYCSWARSCRWDEEIQRLCAEKLCQAAGFEGGAYVETSNSMCEKSVTKDYAWYYLVDKERYYAGRANKESRITASCISTEQTAAPTPPPTDAPTDGDSNVVSTSTQTVTVTTVEPTTAEPTTAEPTTAAPTTTAASPTTAGPAGTTTAGPAGSTTAGPVGTTTVGTGTTTAGTGTSAATTSVATEDPTSTGASTAAATTFTTTPPQALATKIEGRVILTSIATHDSFCNTPFTGGRITFTLLKLIGLYGAPGVQHMGGCIEYWAKSTRRLADVIEVKYEIWSTGATALNTAHIAALEELGHEALMHEINKNLGDYQALWNLTGISDHRIFEQGAVTVTTTSSTTTELSFCQGVPTVLNGGDMAHCADIPSGASCDPICLDGYQMEQKITCEDGRFSVPGSCVPKAARTKTTKAIQMTLSLGSILGDLGGGSGGDGTSPPLSLAWAEENRGSILAAVANTLGLPAGRVLVEFILVTRRKGEDLGSNFRRLGGEAVRGLQEETEEVLEMRVTVLVEEDVSEAELSAMSEQYQDTLVNGAPSNTGGTSGDTTTDANGQPVRGFMAALTTELKAVGSPVPSGMAVEATGPPAVLAQFVVAISEWLSGSWDACSASCGSGQRKRKVECSSGHDLECKGLGERPSDEEQCADYTSCASGITCPLGHESSMDCVAQAGVTLGGASAIGCLCLMVFCRKLQLASRPHTGGTVVLPDTGFGTTSGLKSSYQIYRPDDRKATAPSSSVFRFITKTSLPAAGESGASDVEAAEDQAADGKTRVVWDTDRESLKQMFADRGTALSLTSKPSSNSQGHPGLPRVASASRLDGGATPWDMGLEDTGRADKAAAASGQSADVVGEEDLEARLAEVGAFVDEFGDELLEIGEHGNPWSAAEQDGSGNPRRITGPDGREMMPVYQEGEHVEYFSATLNRWLGATMHLVANQATGVIRYDAVITATRQHRADVALEDVRRPLRRNEPVEVFSRKRGAWSPAVVSPSQMPGAANFGVEVELLGGGGQVDKVPAAKVRRRYAVGQAVKVYRGCNRGWIQGKIEAVRACEEQPGTVSADEGAEEPEGGVSPRAPADGSGRQQRRLQTIGTVASQESIVRELPTCGNKSSVGTETSHGLAGRLWFQICVSFDEAEEAEGQEVDREWVPTYLVR